MKFHKALLLTVMVVSLLCWLYSVGFQYSLIISGDMNEVSQPLGHWKFLNDVRVDDFGASGFVAFCASFFMWCWRYA